MLEPAVSAPLWVELSGGANARDLGGLPTVDGRLTRSGALIRSANLQHLTADDQRHLLVDLGVRRVVDLRSDVEVAREGPGPLHTQTSVVIHHLSLLPDSGAVRDEVTGAGGPPEVDRRALFPGSDRSAPPVTDNPLANSYLMLLDTRSDSVVAALQAFAEPAGSTVVHCAAGKDRTGLVVALALSLVGVRPDAIAADFAASEQRIDDVNRLLGRSGTYRQPKAAPPAGANADTDADAGAEPDAGANADADEPIALKAPKAHVIELVLQTLRDQPGGLDGWLAARGWSQQDTARLRAKLVG
ncbi:MAG: protein tyrosine/serine phosphatase [Frankiales bacterium]|jgi:protein-tyrosine phosphatase|nr:protein tyrosine/serine phosphatase [Frankiales bacterium]